MALKPASLQWSDGNLRSADYGDIYFQPGHARDESHYVFLEKNNLPARFAAHKNGGFHVAELGFGTGLNFLLTAQLWHKANAPGELFFASIEKHPLTKNDLQKVFAFWPELSAYAAPLLEQYPPPLEGFYHLHFPQFRARLLLCLGDVADVLPEIRGAFDAWYLDGFAPAKNAAMWDEKLFPLIAQRTKAGGTLATFSSAGAVRRGLESAGFAVEKVPGYGVKRDMTVAQLPGQTPAAASKKIAVIGAGLAGCAAAYACAKRGYNVDVYDRQSGPAQETSGNPAGVLYPKLTADRSPLGLYFQHGFFFTRHLATALALPSWSPCGIREVATDEASAAWQKSLLDSGHWPEEFLTAAERSIGFPLAGYLSPPELCRALLDHPNIRTHYNTAVAGLSDIQADTVIIACGYDAKNFAETEWLPSVAVRGQMTYLRAAGQNISQVICHDGSVTPAINGIHYAGATFSREEPVAVALREADDKENISKLNKYVGTQFTAADIAGARAGYRTSMPDHLPVLGRCPDRATFAIRPGRGPLIDGAFHDNIYVATGFGGQGLSGAPIAGEIIASLIAQDPLPVPQSLLPFLAPERFIIRDLKRGKA